MDRDEFLRRLDSEPRSDDPEFLAARRRDLEFARLAREADAFEDRLERALALPVDEAAADRALAAVGAPRARRRPRWPLALAAVATLALAVGFFAWLGDAPGEVADPTIAAFLEHLGHVEPGAASGEPVPLDQAVAALAEMGADPTGVPGAVTYLHPCRIGGERGLHLVLTDARRERVTVLFSPGRAVPGRVIVATPEGEAARVFNVPGGAVALVAHGGQDLERLAEALFGAGSPRLAPALAA